MIENAHSQRGLKNSTNSIGCNFTMFKMKYRDIYYITFNTDINIHGQCMCMCFTLEQKLYLVYSQEKKGIMVAQITPIYIIFDQR